MRTFLDTYEAVDDFLAHSMLGDSRLTRESQEELFRYYRSYRANFSGYVRAHYASQIQEVEALIRSSPGVRILEIGCGCGTESIWFAAQGASVLGIDLSANRLRVATERAGLVDKEVERPLDLEFKCSSLFDLDCAQQFDIIWMEQAFHHIEPRDQVAATLRRLLKPAGHVVVSEANGWNPLLQLYLLRHRGLRTIREFTDDRGGKHLYGVERVTVPRALVSGFESEGFALESFRYFRILPNFSWAERFSRLEKAFPQWFSPVFTHFNVVLRKSEFSAARS